MTPEEAARILKQAPDAFHDRISKLIKIQPAQLEENPTDIRADIYAAAEKVREGRAYADVVPDSSGVPDEARIVRRPKPESERGWNPIGIVPESGAIVFARRLGTVLDAVPTVQATDATFENETRPHQ